MTLLLLTVLALLLLLAGTLVEMSRCPEGVEENGRCSE
jgi:hypothetical protein